MSHVTVWMTLQSDPAGQQMTVKVSVNLSMAMHLEALGQQKSEGKPVPHCSRSGCLGQDIVGSRVKFGTSL